jgi:NADH-quinone oxidoreductase subunit C
VASSRAQLPPAEIETRLRAQFGEDVLDFRDQFGHAVATVSVERYHEVVALLKEDPSFALDYCDFVGGVDLEERGFEVVVHLHSTSNHLDVRVKVPIGRDEPICPTISDLYPTANWHEREAMEMFGLRFEGHPTPIKLLLPEPFEGHPLRKDFALMTREAKPWPGAVEGEEEEEEE